MVFVYAGISNTFVIYFPIGVIVGYEFKQDMQGSAKWIWWMKWEEGKETGSSSGAISEHANPETNRRPPLFEVVLINMGNLPKYIDNQEPQPNPSD